MEKPNLTFIKKLSGGDIAFEKELMDVIKTEFPEEKNQYFSALKITDFKLIEESVHKLKHKISILGLEKSYELADAYEIALREKDKSLQTKFDEILFKITTFLENF